MKHHANILATILALSDVGLGVPTTPTQDKQELGIQYDASIVVTGITPEHRTINLASLMAAANLTVPASFNPDEASGLSKRGPIGPDNRQLVPTREWPWKAIGKVMGNGYICSGSLVGPRHVLTARHCIKPGPIRFAPGYDNGEIMGGSNAFFTFANEGGACESSYDFGFLLLQDAIGDTQGYYGLRQFDPATQMNVGIFAHGGYPGDKGGNQMYGEAFIPAHASTLCDNAMGIATYADWAGGQSGGPLWSWDNNDAVDAYGVLARATSAEAWFSGGAPMIAMYNDIRRQYG